MATRRVEGDIPAKIREGKIGFPFWPLFWTEEEIRSVETIGTVVLKL
ncbi:MAG: hypothetical protein GY820_11320 [Gammaproteobacteria bacterium]|nr:hypothetical protein [Gammaproteobacteria bacterium]